MDIKQLHQQAMQNVAASFGHQVEHLWPDSDFVAREFMKLALAAAPAAQPAQQWIPVAERMPDPKQAVLVAKEFFGPGDWRIKVGGYAPDHPDAFDGWHIHGASWTPTHWMPLPATPAAGATGE